MPRGNRLLDLSGQRFGRLVVLEFVGEFVNRYLWLCRCDCGKMKQIRGNSLRRGRTVSCGCYRIERTRGANVIHGHRQYKQSRTYRSYISAKRRCTVPKSDSYKWYGAKGVEFRFTSFQQFLDELGERPEGKTLDRKDPFGHYEPGNVRWATALEQRKNMRKHYDKKSQ